MICEIILAFFSIYQPLCPPKTVQHIIDHKPPIIATTYDPVNGVGDSCNEDCSTTGNGTKVTPELYYKAGACPIFMVYLQNEITISFYDYVTGRQINLKCVDNFGVESHQYPRYIDGRWVISVDIMSPEPYLLYIENYSVRR